MTQREINNFLSNFNSASYNRSQIGNNRKNIFAIYDFLKSLNLNEKNIVILINNLAYLTEDEINISLYLDLLSRTIGFINAYDLKDVMKIVREVHDIYYDSVPFITLENYLSETPDKRTKKLFLKNKNIYTNKSFNAINSDNYILDLKLAAAIILEKREYNEFTKYLDNFDINKDSYSPLLMFKDYIKLRDNLKGLSRLFWDLLFGNEYIIAFNKYNIKITDIYKENTLSKENEKTPQYLQLDLFTYQDFAENSKINIDKEISIFQISSLYTEDFLPDVKQEKDLLAFYQDLINNNDFIILPKLKDKNKNTNKIYSINRERQ